MGVQSGFRKHLVTKFPQAFDEVQLEEYKGQSIAIDIMGLLYFAKYISADPDVLCANLKRMFCRWIDAGIDPVVIFEGEAPIEKAAEQAEQASYAKLTSIFYAYRRT
jgi:hypothetical protein